ncbi:hypothetical protein BJY01DRAFT_241587 [Aspergillus pseudoustus]|uniref:Uncharacterized protein n=1 Tax=Aspergillus pseudoustus TaxID=1810923 RepID=A0ABR4IEF1_9EURO
MGSSPTARNGRSAFWAGWKDRLSQPRRPINPAIQTCWVEILLETEQVPVAHNMAASASTWLLLAGYLVFPGTFTSMRESRWLDGIENLGTSRVLVYRAVYNIPLLGLAAASCWWWRTNLLWPSEQIFLPVLIHSATSILNTVLNVYAARHGTWSIMAVVTAAVTGAYMVLAAVLFTVYRGVLIRRVKVDHQAAIDQIRAASTPCHADGICKFCQPRPHVATISHANHS